MSELSDRGRDRDDERKAERQRQADEALLRQAIAEADLHFDEMFMAREAELDARLAAVVEQAQLAAELANSRPEVTDAAEWQDQPRDDGGRYTRQAAALQRAPAVNMDDLTLEEYAAIRSRPGMPGAIRQDGLFQ